MPCFVIRTHFIIYLAWLRTSNVAASWLGFGKDCGGVGDNRQLKWNRCKSILLLHSSVFHFFVVTLFDICIVVYFLILFLLPLIIEQFFRGNNDTTTAMTSRDIIWREFLDFFCDNPITGNGSVKMRSSAGQHAHNSYIWVLASNGIIIALLYYYYTIRFVNRYNFIPILSILLTSITQSTIYWGLSNADVFLFILILRSHFKISQKKEYLFA